MVLVRLETRKDFIGLADNDPLARYVGKSGEERSVPVPFFCFKLMSLQNKLNVQYHTEIFLRNRLLTAVEISSI